MGMTGGLRRSLTRRPSASPATDDTATQAAEDMDTEDEGDKDTATYPTEDSGARVMVADTECEEEDTTVTTGTEDTTTVIMDTMDEVDTEVDVDREDKDTLHEEVLKVDDVRSGLVREINKQQ